MSQTRRYRLEWVRRLPYGFQHRRHHPIPLRLEGMRTTQRYCVELDLRSDEAAQAPLELVRRQFGDFGIDLVISARLEPLE